MPTEQSVNSTAVPGKRYRTPSRFRTLWNASVWGRVSSSVPIEKSLHFLSTTVPQSTIVYAWFVWPIPQKVTFVTA